jgi:hypothetical protein
VSSSLIPAPGTNLVPDGWCDAVVVPWLAEQTSETNMAKAEATLAGLEAAYRTIGADIFEITKARRLLELRWGELLGKAKPGRPENVTGESRSEATSTIT